MGEQTVVQMQFQGGGLHGQQGLPADVHHGLEPPVFVHGVHARAAQPDLQYRTHVRIEAGGLHVHP